VVVECLHKEAAMASEEIGAYALVAGYGLVLVATVKALGIRRILWLLVATVVVGFALGLKSLGAIVSGARS